MIGDWPVARPTVMSVICAGRPRMAHSYCLAVRVPRPISSFCRRILLISGIACWLIPNWAAFNSSIS